MQVRVENERTPRLVTYVNINTRRSAQIPESSVQDYKLQTSF